MEAITITDMAKATDMVMVDMVKATDMDMADTDITRVDMVIMMDMAKGRVHMAMKTMETKIEMTLLAMIVKKMSKTITDIAMETVDTVRRADMAMETVIMVTVKMDMDTETMDMAMAKMDTEEVTDIQNIQAHLTVIKVIPRVTHQ